MAGTEEDYQINNGRWEQFLVFRRTARPPLRMARKVSLIMILGIAHGRWWKMKFQGVLIDLPLGPYSSNSNRCDLSSGPWQARCCLLLHTLYRFYRQILGLYLIIDQQLSAPWSIWHFNLSIFSIENHQNRCFSIYLSIFSIEKHQNRCFSHCQHPSTLDLITGFHNALHFTRVVSLADTAGEICDTSDWDPGNVTIQWNW